MNWKTSKLQPHVLLVEREYDPGEEIDILLTADHHWDNPECNRDLLKKHHDQALKKEAPIFCFGDLFCAMQGKADPRHVKNSVRPEHQTYRYFDALVSTATDWYAPYADNYVMMSDGNHEQAIARHQETHLLERLCDRTGIQHMPYSGYVIFRLKYRNGDRTHKIIMHYHHGYGGGGPVTKGAIQANRKAVYLPDADICVGGHIHESWHIEYERERVLNSGRTELTTQHHVTLPTYKEEYGKHTGYHNEKGRPPKPNGAKWLRLEMKKDSFEMQFLNAR